MSVQQVRNTVPNVDTDGSGGHYLLAEIGVLDNSGNYHQVSGAKTSTLLPSVTRTATTSTADLTNTTHKGIIVYLNITANSSAAGVALRIQGKAATPGNYFSLNVSAAPITSTGQFAFILYPGASGSGGNVTQSTSAPLPTTWRISITHNDSGNVTYSVDCDFLV